MVNNQHDGSHVDVVVDNTMTNPPRQQGTRELGIGTFPHRLHDMLTEVEAQGHAHIISWQPHGRCFVVHKQREFLEFILPLYFRVSKRTSFHRQLNLYNFQRITTGKDKQGYYHEFFLRGRRDLCARIHRQQIKGTRVRMPSSPEKEPNFYLMDYMPDIPPSVSRLNVNQSSPSCRECIQVASSTQSTTTHLGSQGSSPLSPHRDMKSLDEQQRIMHSVSEESRSPFLITSFSVRVGEDQSSHKLALQSQQHTDSVLDEAANDNPCLRSVAADWIDQPTSYPPTENVPSSDHVFLSISEHEGCHQEMGALSDIISSFSDLEHQESDGSFEAVLRALEAFEDDTMN